MSSTPPSPPKKIKPPRNKPVCPTGEQKLQIVLKMKEYSHLLFFEKPNSLHLLNAKEDILNFCHSIGCMYMYVSIVTLLTSVPSSAKNCSHKNLFYKLFPIGTMLN
jgi:hypothetical protein